MYSFICLSVCFGVSVSVSVCASFRVHTSRHKCRGGRRSAAGKQFSPVTLSPCRIRGSDSGHQAPAQAFLPAEPFCEPLPVCSDLESRVPISVALKSQCQVAESSRPWAEAFPHLGASILFGLKSVSPSLPPLCSGILSRITQTTSNSPFCRTGSRVLGMGD